MVPSDRRVGADAPNALAAPIIECPRVGAWAWAWERDAARAGIDLLPRDREELGATQVSTGAMDDVLAGTGEHWALPRSPSPSWSRPLSHEDRG